MQYTFFGHLCGTLCPDCREDLAHATLRLYRPEGRENEIISRATANPKRTHQILEPKAVKEKSDRLLAEAEIDAEGRFEVVLGEENDYDGEAMEVDVYLESVPGMPEGADADPLQVSITTLQPQWRKGEEGARFGWEYCIPSRFWCQVRERFGVWTICGDVTLCETEEPVEGLTVIAFDRDWIQDDELGSATTDQNGRFRIDYLRQDFEPGTVIDVELIGGPDLYFRVETPGGQALLAEDPSEGRTSSRENAGPCFCVDLCIDEDDGPPPPPPEAYPVFTHVGGYDFDTQIDSDPSGTGETVGQGRAFFRTLRLNGIMAKRSLNGNPLEYKFQYRELGASSWTDVVPSQIRKTKIGVLEKLDTSVSPPVVDDKDYIIGGTPNADEVAASFNGNWIRVPQESNLLGPTGSFVPNHNQIRLDSRTLATFTPAIDLTSIEAGDSADAPSGVSLVQNKHFQIRMLIREQGSGAMGTETGVLENIAVNNRLYDYVRHPNWMRETVNDGLAVAMVNLKELGSSGCEGIQDTLNVEFTAAHPNLGNVNIRIEGPGGPYSTSPSPSDPNVNGSADENLHGSIDFQNISGGKKVEDLQDCSYIVRLSVGVLLTNGDNSPSNRHDQISFCKG